MLFTLNPSIPLILALPEMRNREVLQISLDAKTGGKKKKKQSKISFCKPKFLAFPNKQINTQCKLY